MRVPFLDLQAQYRSLQSEIDSSIKQVLDSSTYVLGPSVERFEHDFAALCGTSRCIGVSSGTSALELILRAMGIGHGDEVITVTNTFFATAEAVSLVGAIPVLVDCRDDDALIDAHLVDLAVTKRTKAIIGVDLYGQPADWDALQRVASYHNIRLIEDACQAHGAAYHGKPVGSFGDAAAFSFYPGKNLGAYGEAGAVTTDDEEIARKVLLIRDHASPTKYHHVMIGRNGRMDGIQGAVLHTKLPHLARWNERRAQIVARYREGLLTDIRPFVLHEDRASSHHLFVVRSARRDELQAHLKEADIQTLIHYPIPIHLQPAYEHRGWKKGDLPVAEQITGEILSLPLHAEMTDEQVEYVIEVMKSFS